jgi:hypothetical protein
MQVWLRVAPSHKPESQVSLRIPLKSKAARPKTQSGAVKKNRSGVAKNKK